MAAFGDSKAEDKKYDKEHGTDIVSRKIYSHSTFKQYWKIIKWYIKYIKETHPECKNIDQARPFVKEWLQIRDNSEISSWTIQTEAAALNKLYDFKIGDPDRFQPRQRLKENITRSRGTKKSDKHFSEAKHEELVNFCKGVGARRNVLEHLKGSDLLSREDVEAYLKKAKNQGNRAMIKACTDALTNFPDQQFFVLHRKDKGGKTRISPIIGPNVAKIVNRFRSAKSDERVWKFVPKACDVHGYRSEYATELYKLYARPVSSLNYHKKVECSDGRWRSEIYACRGDDVGKKLDRLALHKVSIALGHNREDTAISNYIRNL